jgi:hypothetical protein
MNKIPHTSSGSTGSANTPYVSFLPIIQIHNSTASSENKTVPKNAHHYAITHIIINTKTKKLQNAKPKNILL